jgi:ATP-binding cassette, subfamily B, bacterial MsbA
MTVETSAISPDPDKIFYRFKQYLKPYKLAFFVAIIGMIGYSAIDVYVISRLKPVIDDSLGNGNYEYLRIAAYFIVPIFILRGIFNFLGSYTVAWIGSNIVMTMRQTLFSQYIHLPVEYHDKNSTGSLISKVIYDTEQVSNAAGKALLTLVQEGALVIGLLISMFYYSWQLSLIFVLIGPVVAIVVSIVSKRFRAVSKRIQQTMGSLTSSVEQALKGHKVVLMFGGQNLEDEHFRQKNNHNRQQNMKLIVARILSVSSIQVIASIALAFVLYVASFPHLVESLTPGIFVNVVVNMVMLLKPLKQLTTVNSEFQRGMAACSSIFDVMDQEIELDKGQHNLARAQGSIEFKDVTFCYANKVNPALKNISFSVKPGQTCALVGRSGSGKSTIASLLTRFYNHQQGQILLDDIKLNDIPLKDREKVLAAAKTAHVMEFLTQLPNGLDTIVGENGFMLSGGQRQRIAIARALFIDAPVLILDEATSALDTESERLIQDALYKLQQNRTSIVVAHRLSTIENADTILVIESGQIIEQGNHQDLLGQQGTYAQLHNMQFGEELTSA